MTTYRLMDGNDGRPGDGPSSATSYSGDFIGQAGFSVSQGGMWFEGYWYWVCAGGGQSSGPTKFALLSVGNGGTLTTGYQVVPGSVVTSEELTAGQWNYVPLPTPVPIACGDTLFACVGINGPFPFTADQFGSGAPYAGGLTNGPLTMFSDQDAGLENPMGYGQMCFSTAVDDPTATGPGSPYGDGGSNGWIDVQVSDTAPEGYDGSFRLWPNMWSVDDQTGPDTARNYSVGTEFRLTESCSLDAIWYYSPNGTEQLATTAEIWSVNDDGTTGSLVVANDSPSWSGAPASGWVYTEMPTTVLEAGTYRAAVYNGAETPDAWSPKVLYYWEPGSISTANDGTGRWAGVSGITNGPLYAPPAADASTCYEYNVSDSANGESASEPGQSVFWQGPPDGFPNQYVDGLFQNYWVDVEVTPAAAPVYVPLRVPRLQAVKRAAFYHHRRRPRRLSALPGG